MASGSARGATAVPGRSSVEARAGPGLRISDLSRGYVDPVSCPPNIRRFEPVEPHSRTVPTVNTL
eukprot:852460-Prymnesium_polylepis.1